MVLPCGHHEGCMYRYLVRGVRKKFCMGCIVEQFPDCEIFSKEYNEKHLKQEPETKKKKKKT